MSTLDEMEMPTLTFDPAPEEKAPVVPVQEEKAKLAPERRQETILRRSW